jgi:quercetin dioxygenase-like cupin family protein
MTTVLIISIILLLPVIYNMLVPLKPPLLEGYFKPGQTFSSKMEGVTQAIIKQVDDKVYSEVTLAPGSAGPPEHLHISFDESATIIKGTLTVKLNNEIKEMSAGTRISFPKKQYHSFSNTTNSEVVITCDQDSDYIPVSFAYSLAHFYPLMDSSSKLKMVHFLFKMSMFGDLFDSYVVDAPVNAQKKIKTILRPYARVFGYKLYDSQSKP